MSETIIEIGDEFDMLFGPYNAEILLDEGGQPVLDELGIPYVDRLYDSTSYSLFKRQIISNGVFPNPLIWPPTAANSSGLQVMSLHNSMVLTMRMGAAFAEGRFYIAKREFNIPVPQAHLTLGRRDSVVIRHNVIERTMKPILVVGTPSATPQIPPLMRTDDVWDLRLAVITVPPNAHTITQANIQDTRIDNNVCGFVSNLVHQIDTRTLFVQMETFINEQILLWGNTSRVQRETWAAWTEEQRLYFLGLGNEISLLIKAMETRAFDIINNNFDDWSVRRGCDKLTTFPSDGEIVEIIRVVALDLNLATKTTRFNADGSITETIEWQAWQNSEGSNPTISTQTTAMTISKQTFFLPDGSIREEIR